MKKMKDIKNWVFASTKRKAAVLTALGVTAAAGASSLAAFALWEDRGVFPSRIPSASSNTAQTAAAGEQAQIISGGEALAAALKHAGLAQADVTVTENHLDWDDGIQEYDIDFYTDSKKYDYTVNAQTGDIRSYSIEARRQSGAEASGSVIGEDEALAAALKHAGLASGDVQVLKNKLDWDDGVQEYDVEFYTDSKKYDYTVNAQTGEIRSYEIDAIRQQSSAPAVSKETSTPSSAPASSQNGSVIGEDAALTAALKHAGLASGDVQVLKNKLDWDDGVQEYEIEFYSGNTEYDYTVNAQTGAIRSYDAETHAPASSSQSSGVIGKDAALAAALKHAGLTSGDVSRTKVELDRDDGRTEYEIEFFSGGYEYDYTVNAADGTILEHQKEYDD